MVEKATCTLYGNDVIFTSVTRHFFLQPWFVLLLCYSQSLPANDPWPKRGTQYGKFKNTGFQFLQWWRRIPTVMADLVFFKKQMKSSVLVLHRFPAFFTWNDSFQPPPPRYYDMSSIIFRESLQYMFRSKKGRSWDVQQGCVFLFIKRSGTEVPAQFIFGSFLGCVVLYT